MKDEEIAHRIRKLSQIALTAKPSFDESQIAQYDFFRKTIYEPRRVFYPCSGTDASPIRGFPNSEVVLMDKDEQSAYVMRSNGIEQFVQGDVLKYKPREPHDLVIVLNPQLPTKKLTKYLPRGGFILANNWHNNASELLEQRRKFEGIGTIWKNEKGFFILPHFSKIEPHQFATYFYVFRRK